VGFGRARRRGTKGSAAWILDLGEENSLGFLTVFVGQAKIFVHEAQFKQARELNVSRVCELGGGHFFLATDKSTTHLFLATDNSALNMITYSDRQ
jgi:hypothetical protein